MNRKHTANKKPAITRFTVIRTAAIPKCKHCKGTGKWNDVLPCTCTIRIIFHGSTSNAIN